MKINEVFMHVEVIVDVSEGKLDLLSVGLVRCFIRHYREELVLLDVSGHFAKDVLDLDLSFEYQGLRTCLSSAKATSE